MDNMRMATLSGIAAGAWIAEAIKRFQGVESDHAFLIGVMIVWFAVHSWRSL